MRKLEDLKERRVYMLDMCQAVHDFCVKEGINYSLAYGTLLGAYRHKGFIPWDDDFDIMMTREDFNKFQAKFKHPRYKCMTCFNSGQHMFAFPRMVDTETFSLGNSNLFGQRKKGPGICIDLYIVDSVPNDKEKQKKIINRVQYYIRLRKFLRKIMKVLALCRLRSSTGSFFPMTYLCQKQSKAKEVYNSPSKVCICFAGGPANHTVLSKDFFENYSICSFEDRCFMTIRDYDRFLTQRYGDWMTPPPLKDRVPYHGGEYYTEE